MSQIRITPQMMRIRANEYKSEAQKMEAIVTKCTKLLSRLNEEWEGKSALAFQQQFEILKPNLNKMTQLIDTVATQLQQTANAIESLDMEIANRLK